MRGAGHRLLAGETDYHALRPDAWKQAHPETVRIYRAEERLSRADAKAEKRARRRAELAEEPDAGPAQGMAVVAAHSGPRNSHANAHGRSYA